MKARAELGLRVKSQWLGWLVVPGVFVGVVAGFGALALNFILDFSSEMFLTRGVGYEIPLPAGEGLTPMPAEPARRWLSLIVAAARGCVRAGSARGGSAKVSHGLRRGVAGRGAGLFGALEAVFGVAAWLWRRVRIGCRGIGCR